MLDRADYMLNIAESSLADVSLTNTDKPGFRRYIKRVPLGVVLVVAPWKCVPPLAFPKGSSLILPRTQLPLPRHDQLRPPCAHRGQLGHHQAVPADTPRR